MRVCAAKRCIGILRLRPGPCAAGGGSAASFASSGCTPAPTHRVSPEKCYNPTYDRRRAHHHVSDTARWTALHRATESARPDALFNDPLAARLAARRRAIVARAPLTSRGGWWLVAHQIIDDAIAGAIAMAATGC